jgi:hypothetical protein
MPTRVCRCILLAVLAFSLTLHAQISNAGIKGTVKDSTGGVIPSAVVTLTNTGTSSQREDESNREGYFEFSSLAPGEYTVSVKAEGFSIWEGKLTLRVAQTASLDTLLKPASASQTVDVVDVTPVTDRVDPTISDVKESTRIETLPLQNRNFVNLLNFSAGVVAGGFAGQGGNYTRVNGIPGGSMDYLVDGQTAVERFTNELQRVPQPVPTIQEIKVTTSNGSAEYSRPGMVEVVTKSGTNQFHGQLFELNKISALQAHSLGQSGPNNFLVRNEFGGNIGGPIWKGKTFFFVDVEAVRQRSAADARYTVPAAAWKAGDFSTYTDYSGNPVTIYDPLTTTYNPGTKSYVRTAFPGNKIPSGRINPIAAKIMSYIPDPTSNAPYYDGFNYQVPNLRAKVNNTLITAKLDQMFGANRLSARYTHTDSDQFGAGYFLNNRSTQAGGHNGAISYTQIITPNIVNETRAGVQLFHQYSGPQVISPPITQTLGLPTYPGTIAWPSFYYSDPTNNYVFDGIDRDNPKDAPNTTINFADNITWSKGKHSVKLGFSYQHVAVTTEEVGQPGGDYSFSGLFTSQMDPGPAATGTYNVQLTDTGFGLADALLGDVDYAGLNQYPVFHTRQAYYAAYAQDDWKITPKLFLNLGLRWEYWSPFADHDGRAATLNLAASGGPAVIYPGSGAPNVDATVLQAYQNAGLQFMSAAAAKYPTNLWNMEKKNFAPRVGFAYQVDSKTVFRGGYGFYYWAMPLVQYHQNTRKNAPFSYSYQSLVDNNDSASAELTFPIGGPKYANQSPNARQLGTNFISPGALAIAENSGWNIEPWDINYKPQRTQQYNFTLEREFPMHLGARVSYVGNRSDHLVMFDPINSLTPRSLSTPGATVQQRRRYSHFATSSADGMDLIRYNGYANTNSLQTELKQQVNSDMIVQAFFVWQRVLTTAEGSNNSYGALEMTPAALTNNAPDADRLRPLYAHDSSLPQYTFSANMHYVLPFGHGKKFLGNTNGFTNRVVSGWNLTAFYYWRSGLYFSPFWVSPSAASKQYVKDPNKSGALPKDQRTRKKWFDTSAYTARTNTLDYDLLSNIPRADITGPGFNNMDVTFSKITPITERLALHLEAQVFNVYNHVNMANPTNAGTITGQIGNPRQFQFQGKLTF